MFTPIELGTCLQRIAPMIESWTDTIVPAAIVPIHGPTYRREYAWMYAYERTIKTRIHRALGHSLGNVERCLFGADGAVSEALANAFLHGHRRDPGRPIELRCAIGRRGVAFLVRDQGPGFDVGAALDSLARGGTYFHIAGNGLRAIATALEVEAWYSEGGRALTLLVALRPPAASFPEPSALRLPL